MSFQKIGKYKLDDLNKCFYNQHFSKNMIYKLAILNFSKKFISEKKIVLCRASSNDFKEEN